VLGALAAQRGHWCNAELLIEEKLFKPPDLLAEAVAMYRYLCATKRLPKTQPKPHGPSHTTRDLSSKRHQNGSITFKRQRAPEVF